MNDTRQVIVHQSLIRPILILGGERSLALVNIVFTAAMVFGVGSYYSIIIGLISFAFVQWGLSRLAIKDSQFSEVYMRHIRYQPYYPAQTPYMAPPPVIKKCDVWR